MRTFEVLLFFPYIGIKPTEIFKDKNKFKIIWLNFMTSHVDNTMMVMQ